MITKIVASLFSFHHLIVALTNHRSSSHDFIHKREKQICLTVLFCCSDWARGDRILSTLAETKRRKQKMSSQTLYYQFVVFQPQFNCLKKKKTFKYISEQPLSVYAFDQKKDTWEINELHQIEWKFWTQKSLMKNITGFSVEVLTLIFR